MRRVFLIRTRSFSDINVKKEMMIYSKKKQTPVSLKSLMETGRGDLLSKDKGTLISGKLEQSTASQRVLIQVASFLHRELPVRLAHRAERLASSPIFAKNG